MPLQMPHVSVCDSHNELPQSKHCVLAVLEQGKPSASATFRTSTTSQRLIAAQPYFNLVSLLRRNTSKPRTAGTTQNRMKIRVLR